MLEEKTVDKLLDVLYLRADRLINRHETCEKLTHALGKFVSNIVKFFSETGEMDDYLMINIMDMWPVGMAKRMKLMNRRKRRGFDRYVCQDRTDSMAVLKKMKAATPEIQSCVVVDTPQFLYSNSTIGKEPDFKAHRPQPLWQLTGARGDLHYGIRKRNFEEALNDDLACTCRQEAGQNKRSCQYRRLRAAG